jgi:hypothetical protein
MSSNERLREKYILITLIKILKCFRKTRFEQVDTYIKSARVSRVFLWYIEKLTFFITNKNNLQKSKLGKICSLNEPSLSLLNVN